MIFFFCLSKVSLLVTYFLSAWDGAYNCGAAIFSVLLLLLHLHLMDGYPGAFTNGCGSIKVL